MLSNCGIGEDSWESLGLHWGKNVIPKVNQLLVFIGRTDAEAETPVLWPPDGKSQLIGKDPDAGKDRRQEEKGTTEDEMTSPTQWIRIWASSERWWRTEKPGMLQSLGSQRVGQDWTTTKFKFKKDKYNILLGPQNQLYKYRKEMWQCFTWKRVNGYFLSQIFNNVKVTKNKSVCS